jgi:hypothetical protein
VQLGGIAPVHSPHTPWEVQVHSQGHSAALVHWAGVETHWVPVLLQVSPLGQGEVGTQPSPQKPVPWQVWMEPPAHRVAFNVEQGG